MPSLPILLVSSSCAPGNLQCPISCDHAPTFQGQPCPLECFLLLGSVPLALAPRSQLGTCREFRALSACARVGGRSPWQAGCFSHSDSQGHSASQLYQDKLAWGALS